MKISKKNIKLVKTTINKESSGILKNTEINSILRKHKADWKKLVPTTKTDFFEFIEEYEIVKKVELNFPNRKENRYLTKSISDYSLLLSLSSSSYFSHLTAAYLNHLTNEEPKTVYVNTEQSRKNNYINELEQLSIDTAFKNAARTSKNMIKLNGKTIYHLNSKYSNCLGVISSNRILKNEELKFTDLERTLIDITVRSQYAGDVKNVLALFKNAAADINIDKIVTYLKKLKYAYPYHQSLGFYLQRAGIDEIKLKDFKGMNMEFYFYLCNEIEEPAYSKEWKLYYPASFNNPQIEIKV